MVQQGNRGARRREDGNDPARLLLVGGGPRAAMLLERLAANHREVARGPLHVDIVDPFPAGAGRIWRDEQSGLLKLNSMAMDVSMFTDDSVSCQGPAVPGPSLWEWVCLLRNGEYPADAAAITAGGNELAHELGSLNADDFPTRRLQSAYLDWFLRHTINSLPPGVSVKIHRDTVVEIRPASSRGGHSVVLANSRVLLTDAVVLAVGHTESHPAASSRRFAQFAARIGSSVTYVPPAYTNDLDLSVLRAGEDVLVSGMGLAFIDLFVLLMEGRGGRFTPNPDSTLSYHPSGDEPVLHVGSRRGVPYLSKIRGALAGDTAAAPTFLNRTAIDGLLADHGRLNFREHLWPLIAKDAAYSYYRELFTAHPQRTCASWDSFARAFAVLPWYSTERTMLVEDSVPQAADRLDFEALDQPLASTTFDSPEQVHRAVRQVILRDLQLRDGGENSETLGLFLGLLGAYMGLGQVVSLDELDDLSRREVSGWWHGFFSYVDSGPPAHRLQELLALEDAGLIHFLGPNVRFSTDEVSGSFSADGVVEGHRLTARTLIEARLPETALQDTTNELLSSLYSRGVITAESTGTGKMLVDDQCRVVGRKGEKSSWLYAVGAGVSGWNAGAFSRPHSNSAPFRTTDALARTILLSTTVALDTATAPPMSETAFAASLDAMHRYVG
ncbi:FAD/NAD(P)-binding protein [Paeniglutamicibacter terrestris]|uniref:FAD/NAD(P)-binding protein n=1 Tax=Paeniglutamicibacter terrestris TaxID=2723403 RepID=A0ABX1FZA8_9MICC|nr:FAD/NAD(P)-binding protein [Paeniglutamicibacter terrestris]NKG19288.1 FAD/NAD(P)-binding protein [Paeniglutamicibacter terrestris]